MAPTFFEDKILGRSLHSHHIHQNSWDKKLPHEVASERGGSNCAAVELPDKLDFHLNRLRAPFVAVTDHSRDGQQELSRNVVAGKFYTQMMENSDWLSDTVRVRIGKLDLDKASEVLRYCYDAAEALIMYGDERIIDNWNRIEGFRSQYTDRMPLTGTEASLDIQGNLDTELVHDPRCQVSVMSLHPNYDPEAFRLYSTHPEAYGEMIVPAVRRHKRHILAHQGYGCRLPHDNSPDAESAFRRQITWWDELGRACLESITAIEINFSRMWNHATNILPNPKEFPKNEEGWITVADNIIDQTPLLNDGIVMEQLKDYILSGGLFVINGDEHHIPRTDAVPGRFESGMARFGKLIDEWLERYGIKEEQIVNTWPNDKLAAFFTFRP